MRRLLVSLFIVAAVAGVAGGPLVAAAVVVGGVLAIADHRWGW